MTLVVKEFKKDLLTEYNSLPKAIEAIYNDIPSFGRIMRDLALDAIIGNSGKLLGASEEEATELSKMMDDLPQLGKDLTYHLLSAKIKTSTALATPPDFGHKVYHLCDLCRNGVAWRLMNGLHKCCRCGTRS